jgi:hypothetical protein
MVFGRFKNMFKSKKPSVQESYIPVPTTDIDVDKPQHQKKQKQKD